MSGASRPRTISKSRRLAERACTRRATGRPCAVISNDRPASTAFKGRWPAAAACTPMVFMCYMVAQPQPDRLGWHARSTHQIRLRGQTRPSHYNFLNMTFRY